MDHVSDILGKVRRELGKRRGKWKVISEKAGVSHSFINHVHSGYTPNPRILHLQRVYDVLKEMESS